MSKFDGIILAAIGACVLAIVVLILTGCSLTTSINLKCKGECELEMDREVAVKPPTPAAPSLEP
jgi:hypothetical protein